MARPALLQGRFEPPSPRTWSGKGDGVWSHSAFHGLCGSCPSGGRAFRHVEQPPAARGSLYPMAHGSPQRCDHPAGLHALPGILCPADRPLASGEGHLGSGRRQACGRSRSPARLPPPADTRGNPAGARWHDVCAQFGPSARARLRSPCGGTPGTDAPTTWLPRSWIASPGELARSPKSLFHPAGGLSAAAPLPRDLGHGPRTSVWHHAPTALLSASAATGACPGAHPCFDAGALAGPAGDRGADASRGSGRRARRSRVPTDRQSCQSPQAMAP